MALTLLLVLITTGCIIHYYYSSWLEESTMARFFYFFYFYGCAFESVFLFCFSMLCLPITHPCGDGNQPWVRQTAADARNASKHQRLRDHLQHAEEEQFGQGNLDGLPPRTYGTPTKKR
jgi:hypothetical protein